MSEVRIVHGAGAPDLLTALADLRHVAWAPLLGADAAARRFPVDAHDTASWHFVVEDAGGTLLAAGRLTPRADLAEIPDPASFGPHREHMSPPVGFAGRLVVHPDHRAEGLGETIIAARLALARRLGLHQVWGETRVEQVDGLIRHGYEVVGASTDRTVPGEWVIMCAPLVPAVTTRD